MGIDQAENSVKSVIPAALEPALLLLEIVICQLI